MGKELQRQPARNAFTLIELLVVIAVIGILMGLLVPTLARARSIARRTVCQSHLHQWGVALNMYAQEYDNFFPHPDGRDRSGSTPPYTATGMADYQSGWVDVLPPYMGEKSWRDHERYNYPDTGTVFQCPSAQLAPLDQYGYRPLRNGYFSYAMNACLALDSNCWPPYGSNDGNNMSSFLNRLKIKQPTRVIVLFDQLLDPNKGYGGDQINRTAGKYCGSYPKAFSARHAKTRTTLGGNILYADTHVDWQDTVWKPTWPLDEDFQAPPRDDRDWYPY